ncbi:MAG: DUF4276 family protein [Chloroflexi bacterium]|nr:DUF4276 family protein [Chloroflexota bacterium]
MKTLTFTLVTDGSSDTVLLHILTWLLRANGVTMAVRKQWADTRWVRLQRSTLTDRLHTALNLYPCDLLCVHRDAEGEPRERRVIEIQHALERLPAELPRPHAVCVVPVRMTEAWLLFDEAAIKQAAGNRQSQENLHLPPLGTLEDEPDPKQRLHDSLKRASGLRGRRLNQFPVHQRVHRVAELIADFAPLRALPAFQALEQEVRRVVAEAGWTEQPGRAGLV